MSTHVVFPFYFQSSNNNHPAMASTTQEESLDGEADCPIPVSAPVDTSRPYAAQGVRDNSSPVFGRGRGRGRGRGQARVTQPGQLPVTSPARDLGGICIDLFLSLHYILKGCIGMSILMVS